MIGLLCFVLAVAASPFKSKLRLEVENAVLRHQLIVLRRTLRGRDRLANHDRWFFVVLYRWFPSILQVHSCLYISHSARSRRHGSSSRPSRPDGHRRASHRRQAARSGQRDRSPSRGMKDAVENFFEKSENLSACILGPQAPASVRKQRLLLEPG